MPEGDFVRAAGWWAFFATVAAVGFGLWGVRESRRADHWQAEHAEESRSVSNWRVAYKELLHSYDEVEKSCQNVWRTF